MTGGERNNASFNCHYVSAGARTPLGPILLLHSILIHGQGAWLGQHVQLMYSPAYCYTALTSGMASCSAGPCSTPPTTKLEVRKYKDDFITEVRKGGSVSQMK